jgi:phytoene synthase
MKEAYDYCETLVRERHRERFLSALFAPADKRPHLFALYAFDLEIAHIPDAVREPMAGEIRLQWWREVLAGERADEAKANPVAAALIDTIRQHNLSLEALLEVLDARQFDLLGQPMGSQEELDRYFDATNGTIVRFGAQILNPSWRADDVVQAAGRALGMTKVIRNLARDVSSGRLFLSLDVLAAHEIHTASVLGGENTPALRAAIAALTQAAQRNLHEARALNIPGAVLPVFLPLTLVPLYLARTKKSGYDPFRSDLRISSFRSQYLLWRAARRGTI